MCTLSVLRRPRPADETEDDDEPPLWRVTFNRDERRTRPPALPPARHVYDDRAAVHADEGARDAQPQPQSLAAVLELAR